MNWQNISKFFMEVLKREICLILFLIYIFIHANFNQGWDDSALISPRVYTDVQTPLYYIGCEPLNLWKESSICRAQFSVKLCDK